MKKKFLGLFLGICMFFALMVFAKAASGDMNVEVYDYFDFSKVTFTTSSGGTTNGIAILKKMRLASDYAINNSTNAIELPSASSTLAFCLNADADYPDTGLATLALAEESNVLDVKQVAFDMAIITALKNKADTETGLNTLLNRLKGKAYYEIKVTVPTEYMNGESIKYADLVSALYSTSDSVSIEVGIKKIIYTGDTEITGTELNEATSHTEDGDTYKLTLTPKLVLFHQYKVKNITSSDTQYNHALWIIEHAYPTLSLTETFKNIGVSKDTLANELLTLYNKTNATAEETDELIENAVYATVQYAIWKAMDSKVEGVKLGNELRGSDELNKIYKYLIKSRDYSTYGTESFVSSIDVVRPSSKSEIMEETSDTIKYGPYYFTTTLIGLDKINITTTQGKLLNATGAEINSVKTGDKFYILIDKKTVSGEIKVSASTVGGYTITHTADRGKVYLPHDSITQSAIVSGKVNTSSAEAVFDLIVSPKTGIDNIAIIFIASLMAFSLIYVLLTRKKQSYEL